MLYSFMGIREARILFLGTRERERERDRRTDTRERRREREREKKIEDTAAIKS